jgi:hypothetical protein
MRISILLLPLILSLPVQAQSTPFAPVGAQWTYETGIWSGPDTSLLTVQVLSDTVITGRTCSVLSSSGSFIICHAFPQFISNSNDSTFYWDFSSGTHQLLFRWNAVPGDQWSTRISYDSAIDTVDWTVADTGHVTVDGLSLRTISAVPTARNNALFLEGQSFYIERLGDPSGPFRWTTGVCDAETFIGLRCYEDNDISWLNPQYPQCVLSTGIHEISNKSAFAISPSPIEAGEPFTITLRPVSSNAHLRILEVSGLIVFDRTINGPATFSLPQAGMYLVQILGADAAIASQRLIVR